jgi:hypothetical protein
MALAFTNLLEEASTTGGDPVTTSGSVTVVAGRLYLVTVVSSTTATVSSVTLPGTVTEAAVVAGEARGTTLVVSCWWGIPTVGGTGTVTVDFSGATSGTVIIVDEVTGAHATAPIVATNIEGTNDAEHGGGSTTPTFALPNALADANNAIYAAFGASTNTTFTAGTDYTELGEGAHNAPTRTGATEYDVTPTDLTVDATFGASSLWAAIGFEVAQAAGGTEIFGAASLDLTDTIVVAAKKDAKGASVTPLSAGIVAAAVKDAKGASATPLAMNIAAAGKKDAKGSTTVPVTLTIDTAGTLSISGESELALTFGVTTAAKKDAHAAAVTPLAFAAAAAAKKTAMGATVVPVVFTIATNGEVEGSIDGAASLELTFGSSTAATKNAHGAAVTPLVFGVVTSATRGRYGAADLPLLFSISTRGTLPAAVPNMDAVLTGWIASPVAGYTGGGVTGRIRTPSTGEIA